MKRKRQIIGIVTGILICWSFAAFAQQSPVNLLLYRGEVHLKDQTGRPAPVNVGQTFTTDQFPRIVLGANASVFLKKQNSLIQLSKKGEYTIDPLFTKKTVRLNSTIDFLQHLINPRVYSTVTLARGEALDDETYFETFWERVVAESGDETSELSPQDLLAAAAWYTQKNQRTRAAYLLDRLGSLKTGENEFYRQLRLESLRGIRLAEINRELDNTRRKIATDASTLKYKALLIGIDKYNHPAWQELKNPVSDIRAIKKVLENNYRFDPSDVMTLENATYDDIIEAFNQLKQFTGEDTSLLVYFAGHGYYPKDEGEGYWIPRDAGEPESLRLFLPTSTVLGKIKSIKTKHTLLIADSCFSGSLVRRTRGVENNSRFYRDLSRKKSRQIITSGGLEPVDDQGAGNHSIFAGKLISILSRERQEPLSASELAFNLRKEVKNAWGNQTPDYGRLQLSDDENGEFFFVQLEDTREQVQEEAPSMSVRTAPSVAPMIPDKEYTYDHLPKGVCLMPKPFTDLRKCNFRGKKIEDISLEGANLRGVDFKYSNINNLNLKGANLENTDWQYSDIDELKADRVNGLKSDWRYTNINNSDFSHSNLGKSDFRYADLEDVKLDHADMTKADIRYTSFEDVSMEGTILTDVKSNSDELFSSKIQGLIGNIEGAVDGFLIREVDPVTEPQEKDPASVDNRLDSILYLGVKPFSSKVPEKEIRPGNLGIYLGKNLQLGVEYGFLTAENTTSQSEAKGIIDTKGAYLRLFTGGTFNFLFGVNQLTWTGVATAESSLNSSQQMKVTETDVAYFATIGVGNQWLFDSGITIGCDWAMYSSRIGDIRSSRTVEDLGGSATEIKQADNELLDLEDKLKKEDFFKNSGTYLSISLGYSF